MDEHSRAPSAERAFKEQAKRLTEFLSAGGHELKHTHALEAIARVHGFPNYHLLKHSARSASEPASRWIVATYGAGLLPHLRICRALDQGVAAFLHQLGRIAVAGCEELRLRGQDKASHRGLYAFDNGALVCSLTEAADTIVDGCDLGDLVPTQSDQLAALAGEITDAFLQRGGWPEFEERVHDEDFRASLDVRLEDVAIRGVPRTDADGPSTSVARQDRLIEIAQRAVLKVNSPGGQ